ncbi:MAG TPA: glycerol-3-phosphate 1-O-acyltransferase PlsY [candidate division Zixibacteria bacterium]|nr:glycerol-3-phosphate 1-O-acyltransferase PlsY [candidate division Zixibacteria bacterium]
MITLLVVIIAYLIGAVPFGLIVARLAGIPDIRTVGSGNIGATNVWRAAGFKVAVWVFALDTGKGVAVIFGAKYVAAHYTLAVVSPDVFYVICAMACVIGNIFPVYLGFRGGKGVNTALGTMVTMLPLQTLISFGVFLIVAIVFRYISLGSMMGALTLFAVITIERFAMQMQIAIVYFYLAAALLLLILLTHRQNIVRLLAGTENKFSRSGSSNKEKINV